MLKIWHFLNHSNPKYSIYFTALLSALCSYMVYGLYGIHAIDDAWTLSFDYFYYYEGFEFDRVFEVGLGVVAYFGKIHAYLYGFILDIIGWHRGYAQLISMTLILISAWLWYRIAKLNGYEKYYAMAVGVLMLLLDPFMSVAHKARPEALTFLFLSLSIYSFYRKQFFLAGIIAALALESHPMGSITIVYLIAAMLSQYPLKGWLDHKRMLLSLLLGLGIGALFYLLLHGEHLSSLLTHSKKGSGDDFFASWLLYQHFFESRYHRHLPEVFIWLICIGVFIHQKLYKVKTFHFAILALVCVFMFSLLFPRDNKQYAIYIYPAFILMAISIAQHYKKLTVLLLFFCALMLPQYAFVYWKFKGFDFQQYTQTVREITPENNLPIWGHPNHWFAFNERKENKPKRFFYSSALNKFNQTNELLYIRDLEFETYRPLGQDTINLLNSSKSELLNSRQYRNHVIKVYHIKK